MKPRSRGEAHTEQNARTLQTSARRIQYSTQRRQINVSRSEKPLAGLEHVQAPPRGRHRCDVPTKPFGVHHAGLVLRDSGEENTTRPLRPASPLRERVRFHHLGTGPPSTERTRCRGEGPVHRGSSGEQGGGIPPPGRPGRGSHGLRLTGAGGSSSARAECVSSGGCPVIHSRLSINPQPPQEKRVGYLESLTDVWSGGGRRSGIKLWPTVTTSSNPPARPQLCRPHSRSAGLSPQRWASGRWVHPPRDGRGSDQRGGLCCSTLWGWVLPVLFFGLGAAVNLPLRCP